MAVKKINRNEKYMLKGSLRKNGFDVWRLVTCGSSVRTGEEKTFLFEYFVVNPSISPKEYVLGYKSRFVKSASDLQFALAGTESARSSNKENFVQPSFVMVKASLLGPDGFHVNRYFPCEELQTSKSEFIIRAGEKDNDCCLLTENSSRGIVSQTPGDVAEKPELFCNAGVISWNLRFEKKSDVDIEYKDKNLHWVPLGAKTIFAGRISVNGEQYEVKPQASFGYYDKSWGKDFNSPFIHLSSSNFTSSITGKNLTESCFVVQGEHNHKVSVILNLEGENYIFMADKKKKYTVHFDCSEMPEDENDEVKLHWTASVHDRNNVLDIDIYCNTNAMFIRDYESPSGGRKILKVLGGGTGRGELRLYHKVGKNLELIEHANIANCECEYGNIEIPEA